LGRALGAGSQGPLEAVIEAAIEAARDAQLTCRMDRYIL
jgi:hypothetical protein